MIDRSPAQMTPDEIISEINDLHKDLTVRFSRLQNLAQGLYHRVRRSPPDDNTSIYVAYANAWSRFAGMAKQGAVRTASTSKLLRRLTSPNEERRPEEKLKPVLQTDGYSPVEDLILMYGEDADLTPYRDASEDAEQMTTADV